MNTRIIASTLFAGIAILVSSCVNEKGVFRGEIGENEIAFTLAGVRTKAASGDLAATADRIATVKAGGEVLALEESVVSLNGGPGTKGTPAFTENVVALYGSFSAVANPGSTDKSLPDAEFPFNEATNLWTHHYFNGDVWPKAPFTFYMRMPSEPTGVTGEYTYNEDGSIEFDYESPASAAGQQDILFTSTTMSQESENGKEITFYHALTGIKFSNYYTNKESDERTVAKTKIKEVTLSGLNNAGHCKVASDGTVTWTDLEGEASFILSHSDTTNYAGSNYGLDSLLNKKATARNINDADGSLTFWIVPQALDSTSSATITVKFDIELVDKDGGSKTTYSDTTITVSLGARTWEAGQLHTYTLKPVVVGVKIDDDMTEYVKSDVVVENTGNVYEYVRVNLIGNWVGKLQTAANVYDDEETLLSGYKDATMVNGEYVNFDMLEGWNDKDNDVRGYYLDADKVKIDPLYTVEGVDYLMYGKFVKLTPRSYQVPATADSTVNGWVRYDKYYYYTKPIGPDDSVTDDLFESYTVGVSPVFYVPDAWGIRRAAKDVHLVMDLMVQAIPAPVDEDGNVTDNDDNQGYIRAWVNALGKSQPEDLLDL